jgi:hypothetical protein
MNPFESISIQSPLPKTFNAEFFKQRDSCIPRDFNSIATPQPEDIYLSRMAQLCAVVDEQGTLAPRYTRKPLPKLLPEEKEKIITFLNKPFNCRIHNSQVTFSLTPKEIFEGLSKFSKQVGIGVQRYEFAGPSSVLNFLGLSYLERAYNTFDLNLTELATPEGLRKTEKKLNLKPCDYDIRFFLDAKDMSEIAKIENHLIQFIAEKVAQLPIERLKESDKILFLEELKKIENPIKREKYKNLTVNSLNLIHFAIKEFGFYKLFCIKDDKDYRDDQKEDRSAAKVTQKKPADRSPKFAILCFGDLKDTVLDFMLVQKMEVTFNSRHTDIVLPIQDLLTNPEKDLIPTGSTNNGFQAISDFVASIDTLTDTNDVRNCAWTKRISYSIKDSRCFIPELESNLTKKTIQNGAHSGEYFSNYICAMLQNILKYHHRNHPLAAISLTLRACHNLQSLIDDKIINRIITSMTPYWVPAILDQYGIRDHYFVKMIRVFQETGRSFSFNYHLLGFLSFLRLESTVDQGISIKPVKDNGLDSIHISCDDFVILVPLNPSRNAQILSEISFVQNTPALSTFINIHIPHEHPHKDKFDMSSQCLALLRHPSSIVKKLGTYLFFSNCHKLKTSTINEFILRYLPDFLAIGHDSEFLLKCEEILKKEPCFFTSEQFDFLLKEITSFQSDLETHGPHWLLALAKSTNEYARNYSTTLWFNGFIKGIPNFQLGQHLIVHLFPKSPEMSIRILLDLTKTGITPYFIKELSTVLKRSTKAGIPQFVTALNDRGYCDLAEKFLVQNPKLEPKTSVRLWCNTVEAFIRHPKHGLIRAVDAWHQAQKLGIWSKPELSEDQANLHLSLFKELLLKPETVSIAQSLCTAFDSERIPDTIRKTFDDRYTKVLEDLIANKNIQIVLNDIAHGHGNLLSDERKQHLFLKVAEKQVESKDYKSSTKSLKSICKHSLDQSGIQDLNKLVKTLVMDLCSFSLESQRQVKEQQIRFLEELLKDPVLIQTLNLSVRVDLFLETLKTLSHGHQNIAQSFGYYLLRQILEDLYSAPTCQKPVDVHKTVNLYVIQLIQKHWKPEETSQARQSFEKILNDCQKGIFHYYSQNNLVDETCKLVIENSISGTIKINDESIVYIYDTLDRHDIKQAPLVHQTLLSLSRIQPYPIKTKSSFFINLTRELSSIEMTKEVWYWCQLIWGEKDCLLIHAECENLALRALYKLLPFLQFNEVISIIMFLKQTSYQRLDEWENLFHEFSNKSFKNVEFLTLFSELKDVSGRPTKALTSLSRKLINTPQHNPEYKESIPKLIELLLQYEVEDSILWKGLFSVLKISKEMRVIKYAAQCLEFVDQRKILSGNDLLDAWIIAVHLIKEINPQELIPFLKEPKRVGALALPVEYFNQKHLKVVPFFLDILEGCNLAPQLDIQTRTEILNSALYLQKEFEPYLTEYYFKEIYIKIYANLILLFKGIKDPMLWERSSSLFRDLLPILGPSTQWPEVVENAISMLVIEVSNLDQITPSLIGSVGDFLQVIRSKPLSLFAIQKIVCKANPKHFAKDLLTTLQYFLDISEKLPQMSYMQLESWERHKDDFTKVIDQWLTLNSPSLIPQLIECIGDPRMQKLVTAKTQANAIVDIVSLQIPSATLSEGNVLVFSVMKYTYHISLRSHLPFICTFADEGKLQILLKKLLKNLTRLSVLNVKLGQLPTEHKEDCSFTANNFAEVYEEIVEISHSAYRKRHPEDIRGKDYRIIQSTIEVILENIANPNEEHKAQCCELLNYAFSQFEILLQMGISSHELAKLTLDIIQSQVSLFSSDTLVIDRSEKLLSKTLQTQVFKGHPEILCEIYLILYGSAFRISDIWGRLPPVQKFQIFKSTIGRLLKGNLTILKLQILNLLTTHQAPLFDSLIALDISLEEKYKEIHSLYELLIYSLKGAPMSDIRIAVAPVNSVYHTYPIGTFYDLFFIDIRNYSENNKAAKNKKAPKSVSDKKDTIKAHKLEICTRLHYFLIDTFISQMPQLRYDENVIILHQSFYHMVSNTIALLNSFDLNAGQIQTFITKTKRWIQYTQSFPEKAIRDSLIEQAKKYLYPDFDPGLPSTSQNSAKRKKKKNKAQALKKDPAILNAEV